MSKKMLIDSTHPEETRVAVINGNRLEEYDYENQLRKQLKSNIYLVKVTRVEPSLQAAFVDFGGQRHGFLPFPEIHPDYYRIPIADREALLAEERMLAAREAAREDAEDEAALAAAGDEDDSDVDGDDDSEDADEADEATDVELTPRTGEASLARRVAEKLGAENADGEEDADEGDQEMVADSDEDDIEAEDAEVEVVDVIQALAEEAGINPDEDDSAEGEEETPVEEISVDEVGGDTPSYRSVSKRRYKIQEVIKRNQIMLIQISKEERGNKGAAVTSYISLPGRYCVLMPNSPRGGGVSRKVSQAKDRQRLKSTLRELEVPEGMSVILRTAGVGKSTAEIKRDLDYLLRLWDEIREFTLKSTAPQLIYEEGNLIKRAIRDLYKRDIDEVHVAGEEGFKTARDFMQMLAPASVDRVHLYTEKNIPLFYRHQVETQIDAIHSPTVHLKSGGYIVINPTEALVSIDVNSGRATKGRHIEETALKTNIEAAEEVARQLRLRDQGGLIVIDFIDMEDRRANRIVEKKLRDAMQNDRARIQLGRISPFGLLELSRQRLHPSLVETNFEVCKHCAGTGLIRTDDTMAVMVLRALEEEGLKGRSNEIRITVPTDVALYIFNHKRTMLLSIEERYKLRIFISADDKMIKPAFTIEGARGQQERERQNNHHRNRPAPVQSLTMGDVSDFGDDSGATADIEVLDGGEEGGSSEPRRGGNRDRGRGGRERGGRDRDRGGRGGNRDRGGRDRNRGGQRDHVADPAEAPQPAYADAPLRDVTAAGGGHDNNGGGDHGPANGDTGTDRDANRRRGRRGGRRRGGRNRERGPRPEGAEGNGGGTDNAAPANNDQQREPREPRAPRPTREQRDARAEQRPAAASNNEGNGGGGDGDSMSAAGGSRKGWWKRLTE